MLLKYGDLAYRTLSINPRKAHMEFDNSQDDYKCDL